MTTAIGAEVKRLRERRRWTGDDLAARLRAVGLDFTQAAVVNLERRRSTIALHELIALAAVFEIPLLRLVFPDPAADVELLPERSTDGMRALAWATGQALPGPLHVGDDDQAAQASYRASGGVLNLLREHEAAIWDVIAVGALRGGDTTDLYRRRVEALRELRGQIAAHGWPLPPLPDDLPESEVDGLPEPIVTTEKEG